VLDGTGTGKGKGESSESIKSNGVIKITNYKKRSDKRCDQQ